MVGYGAPAVSGADRPLSMNLSETWPDEWCHISHYLPRGAMPNILGRPRSCRRRPAGPR